MTNRIEKLGLGTAQFGMDYGISNQAGKIPVEEVGRILKIASEAGIRILDTAALYGKSEEVLGATLPEGHNFQIVTKTPYFKKDRIEREDALKLKRTFRHSLALLGEDSLYGLMVHHADDILTQGGEFLYEAMLELKDERRVKKIGVSVYNAAQIDNIISLYAIDLIQVPVNLLDQRLIRTGHLKALKKLGIEIHARSVFLQGLLLMKPQNLTVYFNSVRDHLQDFHETCERNEVSPLAACLDFVLSLAQIDCAVVGICTQREINELLKVLSQEEGLKIYSEYAWYDEAIINPSIWNR